MQKSSFLSEFKERNYYNQCTNFDELNNLMNNKMIRAYIGFDCTAPSLHVGSLLQIMCLRLLQKHGHQPIVLLGGGTTRIGDPSGKEETRKILSEKEIDSNIKNIKKILNIYLKTNNPKTKPIYVNNYDWLGKLNYMEFNYMILQAYDFLELNKKKNCLLQIGGSDQWGNIVNGVDLIKRHSSKQVYGLTTPLITTSSGHKMGKTEKGAIWLDKKMLKPFDYWQFWRNTNDSDVIKFLQMFTDVEEKFIETHNKQNQDINKLKIILATKATAMLHGEKVATDCQRTAKSTFENKSIGSSLPVIKIKNKIINDGINIIELVLLTDISKSKSEIRRMIKNRGIRLNNQVIENEKVIIFNNSIDKDNSIKLSHGKKNHYILKII